ncbi:hypothetical protein D3C72_2095650 [compost metagenome]
MTVARNSPSTIWLMVLRSSKGSTWAMYLVAVSWVVTRVTEKLMPMMVAHMPATVDRRLWAEEASPAKRKIVASGGSSARWRESQAL